MADGKWITNLQATMPLDDAARRVLAVRLQVVVTHLPKALHRWKEDPEYVHQLRVGTRRAGAALAIFSVCLPKRVARKVRLSLRNLRRAAGAARDWDVFIASLVEREQQTSAAQRPGLDYLLGYAQAQRLAAQETLQSLGDDLPAQWQSATAGILAAIRKPKPKHKYRLFQDLARPWFAHILGELQEAAAERLDDYERLHQVRILGKRLRYGMEVFAACFKTEFRSHYYPLVEEMQEILGYANDSHVAGQRLSALRELVATSQPTIWKRLRPGVEGQIRFHQKSVLEQRGRFFRWLARWHKSGADAALRNMVETM